MSRNAIDVILAISTFISSIGASAFISGARWGSITKDIEYIKKDLDTIRGLFTLTIRPPDQPRKGP